MQNALEIQQTHQETGVVTGASASGFAVGTASGQYQAQRALSCLVSPEVGDSVLLAVPPRGDIYVLAVLDRAGETALTIASERDIALRTRGTITMTAADTVETRAREVHTTAHRVETSATEGLVSIGKLELVSGMVSANVRAAKAVLGTLDTVLERVSQHVKRSYKIVEELELTRAREVDLRVERCLKMRSQNTLMDAEQIVKVQAEQVHLG